MPDKKKRPRALPQQVRKKSAIRVVIVLLFALAGAIIFGSVARPTLDFIYSGLANLATPPIKPEIGDPGEPSQVKKPPPKQDDKPKGGDTSTTGSPSGEPVTAGSTGGSDEPSDPDKPPATSGGNAAPQPSEQPATPSTTDSTAYRFNPVRDIIPFALLGALLGSWIGVRFLNGLERIGMSWDGMDAGDKVTLFVGIFAGLIASVPLLLMFQAVTAIQPAARVLLISAVTIGLSALSVYALQTMSDILPWNRGRGPMRRSGIKLLDTNVIIDGRVYDVAKTGFLDGQMYVPGFVLEELQYIADSHDALRRQRGRRGLETLRHMQNEFEIEVRIHDRLAPESGDGVDSRLVRLAKAIGADIVTNDWNLRRVAEVQGVHVLSLHDLALALRPNVLPQETLELNVIREGNQPGQGVGYLEDGTMVVIENGKAHIGEHVEVVVTQVIQTERGKMIFGEIGELDDHPQLPRPKKPRPKA